MKLTERNKLKSAMMSHLLENGFSVEGVAVSWSGETRLTVYTENTSQRFPERYKNVPVDVVYGQRMTHAI